MKAHTKALLLKHNEPARYETSSHFDYIHLKNEVIKLVDDLQTHFGLQFRIDDQVQDASFFCDIEIPTELVMEPRPNASYSVRVSNFGKLATLLMRTSYSQETYSTIQGILNQHGFIYIDADELDELYDGPFEAFRSIDGHRPPTWFCRYFDYL